MENKFKYAKHSGVGKKKGSGGPGRYVDPNSWCTGPDPVRHDKYYAYLKHRAQAKFRNEPHSLTWDEWEQLWTDERWHQRGRAKTDLCLCRLDPDEGWSFENCEVVERIEYLKRAAEYRNG